MGFYDYEKTILGYMDSLRAQLLARPLNLGGVTSSGGGAGGGTGYIGQLPQTRITYDTSELAISGMPISGWSLLDNLNHIRYRLYQMEQNPTSPLIVKQNGSVVYSGVTVIDFTNATVTNTSPGVVTITTTGGSGGSSHSHKYNVTLSGTSHFSTPEAFNTNTLRVYYNGIRQDDSYFTADGGNTGFTLTFSANPGDEIFVDYDITASGVTASGGGHIIQDEGVSQTQRSKLNFIGAGVTVTDDSGNDATNVTITASGGGGLGITWSNYKYVASGYASTSISPGYAFVTSRLILTRPLKITDIGWKTRQGGDYNIVLAYGPTLPIDNWLTETTLVYSGGFTNSGVSTFPLNPPLILTPGTYFLKLASTDGSTKLFWRYSGAELNNGLYYTDGTYYGPSYTLNSTSQPVVMSAYIGTFS